jgi:LmbE family N-acetylglucosaminyl deacetylase
MSPATFDSDSRLMIFAPHPDDESLACSIILQRAVRAGAAIRVVYATDGDDNPWPQRLLEHKWRLNAVDRKRWGKLRRAEALAALRVLGVQPSSARFLALPDQMLTRLLTCHCEPILERFAAIISDYAPTHVLIPSVADTHPDHNALAVMLRLVWINLIPDKTRVSLWSYAVHGRSSAFFHRAQELREFETEKIVKLQAIRCHKTQLKLSRRRFLKYAARHEALLRLDTQDAIAADGSIRSLSRQPAALNLRLKLLMKPVRPVDPTVFVLGNAVTGALQCVSIRLPMRPSHPEISDCSTGRRLDSARYNGNAFAGDLIVPLDRFSAERPLFVKLERRSWFFDEAGWVEVRPGAQLDQIFAKAPSSLAFGTVVDCK